MDEEAFEKCPFGERYPQVVYYYFLAPYLLPSNMEKVLYLDSDILVNGSLLPLFDTDLSEVAIAGCEDFTEESEYQTNCKRLGYPIEYGHINGGVVLINLNYWRENHVSEQLFQFIANNREKIIGVCEDALNGVLFNKTKRLPGKYDVLLTDLECGMTQAIRDRELSERPVIMHYQGSKPWEWYLPDYPFKAQWDAAKRKSPWKRWDGTKPLKERLRRKLLMTIKCLIGKKPHIYDDAWKVWA